MKKLVYGVIISFMTVCHALAFETTYNYELLLTGEYTDNLDRTSDAAQEDYLTSISPGVTLGLKGETAELTLAYNPAYVQYMYSSDRNQWRHYASLTANWRMSRYTQFNLSHSLTVSEDPIDIQGTTTVTTGTNRYMYNSGTVGMLTRFGREDSIAVGYNYTVLDNEQGDIEDSMRSNPYMDFTWWFIENRYGMTLRTDYTRGTFQRSDDFNSYSGNLRLLRRFSREFDMFLQYAYMQTDYDGPTENYKVHNPAIGFNYTASEQTNMSLAFGYGIRDRQYSSSDEGPTIIGDINTRWAYRRGSINFHANSGYTQDTFSTENLGFYIYSGADVRADYSFTRQFGGEVFGTYRFAKYLDAEPNIEDNVVTGGAALMYQALSWMRFRLEYAYNDFMSTEALREYTENRATLTVTLGPATPYRL